jgi:tetratricopeptide (TPR) repeat protein
MQRNLFLGVPAAALVFLAGCGGTARHHYPAGAQAPLFSEIGPHQRKASTSSALAQRYFDQGLTWAYAFNHDEAIRSFREAARLDPQCAMAWWGIALCNGPHINNPIMTAEQSRRAWEAIEQARALREHANPTEQALIDALGQRYADPPPSDRRALDEAYAAAMRGVWEAHKDDPDVGTLYAESLMDLRPWDLWSKQGEPRPETEQVLAVLEAVMRMEADHPGANHLYIHAVEASPEPARASAAADRLRRLVPVSGHLTHMPSHIDVLTGRWELAAQQNDRAIRADRAYRQVSPKQGFYRVYMAHNHHMLAFASMMSGRSATAVSAARNIVESVPEEYMREQPALVDPFMGATYDALKRFGRWDEILAEPAPPEILPISTAMWRFSRAVALAAKGDVAGARREQAEFRAAEARVPGEAIMMLNKAHDVLAVADEMLAGEIAYREGKTDEAVASLRRAIEREDALMYMEPPEWIQPVRHTLGAVLLDDGRYTEAEEVYRADLRKWPNNGWSLYGLLRALEGQGREEEAKRVEEQFEQAWARADVEIESSCLCVERT